MILFIGFQVVVSMIILTYSFFDEMEDGTNQTFESFDEYWLTLGLLHLLGFTFVFLKSFLMEVAALRSNEAIHNDMVKGHHPGKPVGPLQKHLEPKQCFIWAANIK